MIKKELIVMLAFAFFNACQSTSQSYFIDNTASPFSVELDHKFAKLHADLNLQSGFAIGVIKNDSLLFSKGYGYGHLESKSLMSSQTIYYTASTTKSFVALLAAILESKGLIDLNESIKTYLPELDMGLEVKEEEISILDLITHTHGIDNLPFQWLTAFVGYNSSDSWPEIMNRESTVRPNRDFRYSNLGMLLTGIVLEKVTGKQWKELLQEYIFIPLEMKNTSCYVTDYAINDIAHTIDLNRIPNSYFDKKNNTMHPAGGIMTTIEDMLKYVSIFVNDGFYKNTQFVSKETLEKVMSAIVEQNRNFGPVHRIGYGIGLDIAIFNGERHISRFGGFQGIASQMSFLPDHNIAVVSFSNDPNGGFAFGLAEYAYNHYLGKDNKDEMFNNFLTRYNDRKNRRDSIAAAAIRPFDITYKHRIEDVIGLYKNDIWGELILSKKSDTLYGAWGNIEGNLRKQNDSVYILESRIVERQIQFIEEDKKVTGLINGSLIFSKEH